MLQITVQGVLLFPGTVLADRNVITGIKAAYDRTQNTKWEHGGWIFFNAVTGEYRTNEKTDRSESGVILTPPPAYRDPAFEIVADWHCHPGGSVGVCRPSDQDIANAKAKSYFMFVATARKEPKHGWQPDFLAKTNFLVDNADYRVWHIF